MVDVVTHIEINKSLSDVVRFACDPDNATKWYKNIKEAKWKTEKPLRVGSQIDFVAHFLGKNLCYTYEIKELSDTKLVMSTSQGPFPMTTTYSFEKLSDTRTRMSLRNHGQPSGFSKLMTPFISWMMRIANNNDLQALKIIVEQ